MSAARPQAQPLRGGPLGRDLRTRVALRLAPWLATPRPARDPHSGQRIPVLIEPEWNEQLHSDRWSLPVRLKVRARGLRCGLLEVQPLLDEVEFELAWSDAARDWRLRRVEEAELLARRERALGLTTDSRTRTTPAAAAMQHPDPRPRLSNWFAGNLAFATVLLLAEIIGKGHEGGRVACGTAAGVFFALAILTFGYWHTKMREWKDRNSK